MVAVLAARREMQPIGELGHCLRVNGAGAVVRKSGRQAFAIRAGGWKAWLRQRQVAMNRVTTDPTL